MIMVPDEVAADPVLDDVADIWTRQRMMRPSEWAERERWVSPDASPEPGQWKNKFLPWIGPILDLLYEEPNKRGLIIMKYAQAGVSEIWITLMGWFYCFMAGPVIFICSRKEDARKFGLERVDYMVEQSPMLRRIFRRGKGNHETMYYKEAAGGAFCMGGAGSANDFISKPARHVGLDEYDDIGNIPGHGDPWEVAEKRLGAYELRVRTTLCAWAHPTHPSYGIARVYNETSDQRTWCWDCPHCAEPFKPLWDHVRIEARDPDTARFHCPHCGAEISDAQRWRQSAVTGRFVSQLDPEAAAKRQFIGLQFGKLSTPRLALRTIAGRWARCKTEAQLKVFYNKEMGEPWLPASAILTEDMIREKIDPGHTSATCPQDTWRITMGVDVQKPKERPTLYYVIIAWTRLGNAVILKYGRASGWNVLDHIARTFRSKRPRGEPLAISACGIDSGWVTQQVYGECRKRHGSCRYVAMRHEDSVRDDAPVLAKDTIDPQRPHLGAIKRLRLCRTHWMDRWLGRFRTDADPSQGGSVVLPAGVEDEFIKQQTVNVRLETLDKHGHPLVLYQKIDESLADDWAQAGVYAEVVAAVLGLDDVHEDAPLAPPEHHKEMAEKIVAREERDAGRRPRQRRRRRPGGRRMQW